MNSDYWFQGELYKWRSIGNYPAENICDMLGEAKEMGCRFAAKGKIDNDGNFVITCNVFGNANEAQRFKNTFYNDKETKQKSNLHPNGISVDYDTVKKELAEHLELFGMNAFNASSLLSYFFNVKKEIALEEIVEHRKIIGIKLTVKGEKL